MLEQLQRLAPLTDRVRVMGAQAITYCHLAAGRTDAVAVLKPSRTVDFAAAQLLVRERGFAIERSTARRSARPLDLTARSRICAAGDEALLGRLADALLAAEPSAGAMRRRSSATLRNVWSRNATPSSPPCPG